jgi:hypothetical protein
MILMARVIPAPPSDRIIPATAGVPRYQPGPEPVPISPTAPTNIQVVSILKPDQAVKSDLPTLLTAMGVARAGLILVPTRIHI